MDPDKGKVLRTVGVLLLLAHLSGCSLISVKNPSKPLSTQEMNTRILTREYAAQFRDAVEQSADDIITSEAEPQVAENALRWKSAAVGTSQRASMQIVPMMGLLDSWTLALQMEAFISQDGAGRELFGTHQATVQALSTKLAREADALAARLLTKAQLEQANKFVAAYVHDNPLIDLRMARPSVVIAWNRGQAIDQKLIDSVGTVPEATTDLAQRLQIYNETTPSQVMWQAQLALLQSGYSREDLRDALKRLDERLGVLAAAADTAPEDFHKAVNDVRKSMLEVVERLNSTSQSLMQTLHTEREAMTLAVDAQRKAFALDATQIAAQVVKDSGEHLRLIAREAMLWLVLLAIAVLSLPFAAGYFTGRARGERLPQQAPR